jgi:hypothetical protein
VDKPSSVVLDANVCIDHALDLGKIHGSKVRVHECKFLRCFVDGCIKECINIGTFQTAVNESFRNLRKATNELLAEYRIKTDPYDRLKWHQFSKSNLDSLFRRIALFKETYTGQELQSAEQFFRSFGKTIVAHYSPQKSAIPGRDDLVIFISTHNLGNALSHLLSNDRHFTEYEKEIASSPYRVRVLPLINLGSIVASWNWPIAA